MKILPEKYQCEVCKDVHDTKEEALRCESKRPSRYTVGCIYASNWENITLAVAQDIPWQHWNNGTSWAMRDNGHGDSEELKDVCGSGGFLHLGEHQKYTDFKHPTFKRMLEFLKKHGVKPTIWDGEKAVPYNPATHC